MANADTLTINDAVAVPHTFAVDLVSENTVQWRDSSETQYFANPNITLTRRRPTVQNGNFKATLKVRVPVMDITVTPAELSHELLASLDIVYKGEDEAADINDVLAYLANCIAAADVSNALKNIVFPH